MDGEKTKTKTTGNEVFGKTVVGEENVSIIQFKQRRFFNLT